MMRRLMQPGSAAVVAILTLGALGDDSLLSEEPPSAQSVVVELFTSQGCSSCPPADRLLARLGKERWMDGIELIPLAFHVDYWNYIGWQDPFSSADWSDRQRAYATAFDLDTIYTPQVFLNGRRQVVGADEREIRREIRRVARTAPVVDLELAVDPQTLAEGDLRVRAAATVRPGEDPGRLFGMLVIFQDGLVTPVSRGENASKTLENERVVRGLYPLLEIGPETARTAEKTVDLALDPDWPRDDLGLVFFAQDPASLAIHGAELVHLRDLP